MPDMFVSLVAGIANQSKTSGGERLERAPGLTPQVKDGIWNERAAAYAGPVAVVKPATLDAVIKPAALSADLSAVLTSTAVIGTKTANLDAVLQYVPANLEADLSAVIIGPSVLAAQLDAVVIPFLFFGFPFHTEMAEIGLDAVLREQLYGLISYWPMTDDKDVKDSNNGSGSVNITFGTGKIGNACIFTGSGGSRFSPNQQASNLDLTAMSVSAWVKPSNFLAQMTIVAREIGINRNYRLGTLITTGQVFVDAGTIGGLSITGGTLVADAWNHVVFTRDASNFTRIYINSVVSGTGNTGPRVLIPDNPTIIGDSNVGTFPFIGRIDEVGIWDRELTQDEVDALFHGGAGLPYPFF